MDYQVSARKYRPAGFQDVMGQPHVVKTLMNSIAGKRIAHAFLFSGSRGVGKTTVARILAKSLNCEQGPTSTPCDRCANCLEIAQGNSVDVIEIDGASNTSVDDVREIRENIKFTPFRGHYRVYIIDEVHMLSNSAFNALLKTLEEPPAHVVFIFATTEIHKIPATILSRCQHYNFLRIARSEIMQRLRYVADQDSIVVEDRSLTSLARASEGSMRDALSLLDQAVSFGGKTIRHDHLLSLLGSVPQELVRDMMATIVAHDGPAAVRVIARLLDQGHDLRAFCAELVEHIRNLLVASVVPGAQDDQALKGLIDLSKEEVAQIALDAKQCTTDQLQELFRIFSQAEDALRVSPRPRFVLEVAAIRATRLGTADASVSAAVTMPTPPAVSPPRSQISTDKERRGPVPSPTKTQDTAPSQQGAGRLSSDGGPSIPKNSASQPKASLSQPQAAGVTSATRPGVKAAPAPLAPAPPRASTGSTPTPPSKPALPWEKVVERVEQQHPNIGPFLAMATFMNVENGEVTIGYLPTASIALARVQKEEALQIVSGICTQFVGQPMRLRVVELHDGQRSGPSVAELRAVKERSHKQQLLEQSRSHPLVKQTLATFGGDVVDVRATAPREEAP
ncbi:DNA polymerase III subunit gamma/tau [Nitrospira sp. Nam74]